MNKDFYFDRGVVFSLVMFDEEAHPRKTFVSYLPA